MPKEELSFTADFTRLCLNLKADSNKAEEMGHRNRWQKYC